MLWHPSLIPLLKVLYPITEPNYTRDRPLAILAVGLSRSGTDSLRNALKHLGYDECHHGFHLLATEIGQGPQWSRLMWRKDHTDPALPLRERGLDAKEFDKCLGNCAAVTDIPSAAFACELIRAYPDANVIINRRDDIDAWHKSILSTIEIPGKPSPFKLWRNALFDPELFWVKAVRTATMERKFDYDIAGNGKRVYREHYQEIDELLAAEAAAGRSREVLRWKVQDGWGPLTEFLGKKVPVGEDGKEVDFPSGNTTDGFAQRRVAVTFNRVQVAAGRRRRFFAALAFVAFAVAARLAWAYMRG